MPTLLNYHHREFLNSWVIFPEYCERELLAVHNNANTILFTCDKFKIKK